MINLIEEQVFAEPVKCWVKDRAELVWSPRWLIAIADGNYFTVAGFDHNNRVTSIDVFKYGKSTWRHCSLTDPTMPTNKTKENKGEQMIDLNINQIVDPPVKCWMRCFNEQWEEEYLYVVDHRIDFPFGSNRNEYKQCSLTDPTVLVKKIKKWETIEDIPLELWGRALVKSKNEKIHDANMMTPYNVINQVGCVVCDLVYLPLGQPLDGEWLPFESEVVE